MNKHNIQNKYCKLLTHCNYINEQREKETKSKLTSNHKQQNNHTVWDMGLVFIYDLINLSIY